MEKFKTEKFSSLLSILKCCLIGIVVTLVGIVIFAVILKFFDLNSAVINYVNDVIKALSIFIMLVCVKRANSDKFILKSIIAGFCYDVLSFVIFSIMNGSFSFDMSILFDLLFAIIVAVICAIILNLTTRKI